LEDTIFIRSLFFITFNKNYSEACNIFGRSLDVGEWHSDVRIQHDELQLKLARDERLPRFGFKVVGNYASFVGDVVVDFVFRWLVAGVILLKLCKTREMYEVMEDVFNSNVSSQLEGPVGDAEGEVSVGIVAMTQ
jgi:hypothetical protein